MIHYLFQVTSSILNVTNAVLRESKISLASAQVNTNSSINILLSLDKIATKVSTSIEPVGGIVSFGTENIALIATKVKKENILIESRENVDGNLHADVLPSNSPITTEMLARISIPENAFQNSSSNTLYSYTFRNDKLFYNEPVIKNKGEKNASLKLLLLESTILSATIGDHVVKNLTSPVNITFQASKSYVDFGTRTCYFWNDVSGK